MKQLLAGLVLAVLAQAAGAANVPAAADPWSRVPAFPTSCYLKGDPVYAKFDPAIEAVDADIARQKEINDSIRQQQASVSRADPMEMARRMQEKMMADPQNAMKYMQGQQALAQQGNAEAVVAQSDKENQMKAEAEAVDKRFKAALHTANGPGNARWTALKKKLGIGMDSSSPGEMGVPAWAWTEWYAINREWDRAYRATCPAFFGTGGEAHAFMQKYRTYLVQERIPYDEKSDQAKVAAYAMFDTPAASYKSLATLNAVRDHIAMAQKVFGFRRPEPICHDAECK
jgi:hypothetical protein